MQNVFKMLEIEREQARLGRRPDGEAVPWNERAVHSDVFWQHQQDLPKWGLRVIISLFVGGNNAFPNNTLIGLKVVPQEPIMTYRSPYKGTPWHISVGFSNDDGSLSKEALAFIVKYSEPREVRLKIKEVNWRAVTTLADDDSLVTDPVFYNFWKSSYYKKRGLHITF